MTGVLVGVAVVALGVYLVVAAVQQSRSAAALVASGQRVPTVVVGEFTVRRAAPSDVAVFIESMDEDFRTSNGWTPELVAAAQAQLRQVTPDRLGYLAVCRTDDDAVLGFGTLQHVKPSLSRCGVGFVLHPSRRGRGLGPGAFAAVVEAIHRAGIRTIRVGTSQSNTAMVTCITRAGGTEVSRGPKRLPDGSLPKAIWFEFRGADVEAA